MLSAASGDAKQAAPLGGGTLRSFFGSHGFGGAALERRLGNHLFVAATINGKHTALFVDTGAPMTLIDRNSAGTLGLSVQSTNVNYGGVFGKRWEHFGLSKLRSIAMGNCTLTNVPVALADESDMNYYSSLPHIDGLFGAREMLKFGMVIDCARQMIYISATGPNAATSQQLSAFLTGRGFTRIPLRLTSNHHFDVPAAINGHPTRLIVDTGSGTTLLGKESAIQCGVVPGSLGPFRVFSQTADGRRVPIESSIVKDLEIGDFKITSGEVEIAPVDSALLQSKISGESNAGLLGEEYLSFSFAVIDMGGMSLYLRHADSR